MEELKDKSIKELAVRLNEINVERNKLDIEYNKIVYELWERVPSLKADPNLELKRVKKVEGKSEEME